MDLTIKGILTHLAGWFVAGIGLGLGWWIGGVLKNLVCKLKPAKKAEPKTLVEAPPSNVVTDEKKA